MTTFYVPEFLHKLNVTFFSRVEFYLITQNIRVQIFVTIKSLAQNMYFIYITYHTCTAKNMIPAHLYDSVPLNFDPPVCLPLCFK